MLCAHDNHVEHEAELCHLLQEKVYAGADEQAAGFIEYYQERLAAGEITAGTEVPNRRVREGRQRRRDDDEGGFGGGYGVETESLDHSNIWD